jgi:hypothetical protein
MTGARELEKALNPYPVIFSIKDIQRLELRDEGREKNVK